MHELTKKVYMGVDVAKETLSINMPNSRSIVIANRIAAIRQHLASASKGVPGDHALHVCFEATGCYPRKLKKACGEADILFTTLNPHKVKKYAESISIAAKTDSIDAKAIRLFAEHRKPSPDLELSPGQEEMRELANLRRLLVTTKVRLQGFLESAGCSAARLEARQMLRSTETRLDSVTKKLMSLRDSDPLRKAICGELAKIAGIGDLTAILIVALVPELGTLGRRRSAALAGLAPYAHESGDYKGLRYIRGGRFNVRLALYMATLSAAHYNHVLKALYDKKLREGKPKKVALVCVMRKLFAHMDRVAAKAIKSYEANAKSA
jgi:transposase